MRWQEPVRLSPLLPALSMLQGGGVWVPSNPARECLQARVGASEPFNRGRRVTERDPRVFPSCRQPRADKGNLRYSTNFGNYSGVPVAQKNYIWIAVHRTPKPSGSCTCSGATRRSGPSSPLESAPSATASTRPSSSSRKRYMISSSPPPSHKRSVTRKRQ